MTWDREAITNSDDFRATMSHFIPLLGTPNYGATIVNVEPDVAWRNQGKFFKLIKIINPSIPFDAYWAIMRINGYDSPDEYDGIKNTLVMIDYNMYSTIVEVFASNQTMRQKQTR